MIKEYICKWCGQNDMSLHKQCAHTITLQLFKNEY